MNRRWYITGLIIALAILGMGMQQTAVPNQEIVLQFNSNSINNDDAQRAISEITLQLKEIGVANFQVSALREGKVKVTYFSTIDVAVVKNLFKKQNNIPLADTGFNKNGGSQIPFSKDPDFYHLDVLKIQKDYSSDLGFHGLPIEIKSLKDQYLNQIVSLGNSEITFAPKKNFEREIVKIHYNPTLSIDNTSHKIPEVRAGPFS